MVHTDGGIQRSFPGLLLAGTVQMLLNLLLLFPSASHGSRGASASFPADGHPDGAGKGPDK